ncbi:MAG: HlyD family efflux transporter periplasmic adaptor subunit [Victivallaceae bacterium]|nr:HlyD family efflux transporter periplasmic adaptor subunit [Victivallaceae bacterium]
MAVERDNNSDLRGRLAALSAVIKLGHEAFRKSDLAQWREHVVNNSVLAFPYNRSCLFEYGPRTVKLIQISGVDQVNQNGEYAVEIQPLAERLRKLERPKALDESAYPEDSAAQKSLAYLKNSAKCVIACPVNMPGTAKNADNLFVWLIESDVPGSAAAVVAVAGLLAENYSEALGYLLGRRTRSWKERLRRFFFRSWLTPWRIVFLLLFIFVLALIFWRVPQTVSAEFSVTPEREQNAYAPYDGVVKHSRYRAGVPVRKSDVVLEFDLDERRFALAGAETEARRNAAALAQLRQQSFQDSTKRASVRLLELQLEKCQIDIARNQWYLDKGVVRAEFDGVLDIPEPDRMEGRQVHAGERLFGVLSTENLCAEIELDEVNASSLTANTQIKLYLHTRPGIPIEGRVLSVSPKPVLTAKRNYCYVIRVAMSNRDGIICGMRGIARVSGDEVTLGYYLVRHLILWYRRL